MGKYTGVLWGSDQTWKPQHTRRVSSLQQPFTPYCWNLSAGTPVCIEWYFPYNILDSTVINYFWVYIAMSWTCQQQSQQWLWCLISAQMVCTMPKLWGWVCQFLVIWRLPLRYALFSSGCVLCEAVSSWKWVLCGGRGLLCFTLSCCWRR